MVRILDSVKNMGADLSECLNISMQIEEGNAESWYQQWSELGHLTKAEGEKYKEQYGATASASFLRASNYFRHSYAFLFYEEIELRIARAFQLEKECFSQAKIPYELLTVPYGGSFFKAHFYPAANEKAPVLILNQGYEGSQLDGFFSFYQICQKHQVHLLTFDGPGQGEQLIQHQTTLPLHWETVLSALLDQMKMPVAQICLIGLGWGALLASLAAAHEKRIDALVLAPGIFDPLIGIKKVFPDLKKGVLDDQAMAVNTCFGQALSNRMLASKFKLKMLAHGVDSPFELVKIYSALNLESIASKIRCPTLIFNCPDDPIYDDQAKLLYDKIASPQKSFHQCKHWNSLLSCRYQSLIFNWMDTLFNAHSA